MIDYNLLNMIKAIYFLLLLLILTNTQVIRVPTLTTTTTYDTNILLRTQTAYVYHGTIDIQITDGEQKNLDFYVHLVPEA
jgi:hypothetical protein